MSAYRKSLNGLPLHETLYFPRGLRWLFPRSRQLAANPLLNPGGFIVLGDVTLASVISAIVIAWALLIVGVIQVVHAFSASGWKGFLLDLLVGALYIAAGYIILANPLAATIKLTLILGIIWLVSGVLRIVLAGVLWRDAGWLLLLSGIIGVLAGGIIISEWPQSGLWV